MNKVKNLLYDFVNSEQSSGLVLIFCAVIALVISNTGFSEQWFSFWDFHIGNQNLGLDLSIINWVNDGLMAIFFLLVGLEIKREIIEGELSSFKKSLLPIAAAIGGMLVPALIYFLFNVGKPSVGGWGIPMATDIAFSLGVLSMLGKRVPFSLKIMLTALAIVDDLGAILVIAFFYSHGFSSEHFFIAIALLAFLFILNKGGVTYLPLYLIIGGFLWYFTFKSGIHSTIAGVALAFMLPLGKGKEVSAGEILQQYLHHPVSFIIVPLFALANTGFVINSSMAGLYMSTVSAGVFLGLFIGKPIGITLFSVLSYKLKLAKMPTGATIKQIIGVGFLGGIGYTMSIFVTLLAFDNPEWINFSKASILIGSVSAGLAGYLILRK